MPRRTFAIGDIHGCSRALEILLDAIRPGKEDTIITLGDYVDKGRNSRGVIDLLISLQKRCRLVSLLGNHDEMMRVVRAHPRNFKAWLKAGGDTTLASYGSDDLKAVPEGHWRFLAACPLFHETASHFFVHANYDPLLPLERQRRRMLLCWSMRDHMPGPHRSGKIAVLGHTPRKSGDILNLAYLKGVDTCCWNGGWLTALEVASGTIWQASEAGALRRLKGTAA